MVTITSYPFENLDTTESQFSRLFVELQDTGVCDTPDSTALKVSANGNDLTLTIEAGFAIVRGHAMDSSAQEFRTLEAAEANPRIDRVVLRLDPIANQISIEVLKGTASASPTVPSLTQTVTGIYEMSLAQILVPSAALALSNANVTDERHWSGGRIGAWTTPNRPVQPRYSQAGFNLSLGEFEYYDGTQWRLLVDPTRFLAANAKAVDSDKLDGLDSTAFLGATAKAVDSDKLDGLDSTAFARKDTSTTQSFTGAVSAAGVYDGGQRVYSAVNPPPINAMTVLGGQSGTNIASASNGYASSNNSSFQIVAPSNGRIVVKLSCNTTTIYNGTFNSALSHYLSVTIDGVYTAADDHAALAQGTMASDNGYGWALPSGYAEVAFTGLSPGATYTVRPMSKCGSTGVGPWSVVVEG